MCRRPEICSRVFCTPTSKNIYKFWWSQELDCLKQASTCINSNSLWLAAGKPHSGPILTTVSPAAWLTASDCEMNNAIKPRLTLTLFTMCYSKKGPTFWKCWRSKFTTSSRCIEVDGCTDSTVIADNFSNYFKKIYNCNDQTS